MIDDRIGKSVTRLSKTDSTQYLWDINHGLPQVLTESDAKGTALYSYGLGRISMADPRKGQMYYQYDGLGSVRSLTDRKGMTRGLYAYDAFGKPLISASPVDNDFQYTGEQLDDETGLIYLRSRYYDPEIGRFISKDSFAGFDTSTQSLNRYTYVQNNPVAYSDPNGKNPILAAAGLAGLYGACANTGWYIGSTAATYVKTGQNTGSWATLGGRAAGGFAGGVAAVGTFTYLSKDPRAIGAAASGTSYAVDRWTQGQLSNNLRLGSAEQFKPEEFAMAIGGGAVMGPVTNYFTPFPAINELQRGIQAGIFRSGMASLNYGYSAAPSIYSSATSAYTSAINSCQGSPVRLGGGSISLPGQKLN